MLGYSEGELETLQVLDVVPPEHRETLMSLIAEWVQGHGADEAVRFTLLRKDGSRVQTEISSALITWRGRQAILAVVTDITQRLHAEAALDFQREIISTALRYAPVGVTVVTADHAIVLWNDCQAAIYGVPAAGAEGRRLENVLAASTAGLVLQRVDEVLQRGEPSLDPDYEVVGHDGSRRTINLAIYPLKGALEEIVGAALLALDVTEQRAAEERLRQAAKMEALGQLAGGVAHDFRNLLTAMLGNLSLARSSAPAEIAPLLRDAEQAAQRAVGLVGQLLAFSRKTPTRMVVTDVNAIAAEAVGLMRSTLDRRIEVEVRPEAELALVQGDGNQLHQVIVNLMINARDAVMTRIGAEKAAGTYRITVATRHAELDSAAARTRGGIDPGRYVVLAVQDTGCGMDRETRQHLFEPFFTTKAEGQGTGLGMATVYSIVRQHRGWIDLASRERDGTTIEIYLPEAAAAEPEPVASGVPEVRSGHETVLLVDDEAMIRDLGRRVLERAGYEVVTACDGREALQVLSERPDGVGLMILDMSMPGLSGHDVLVKLRESRSALRVIIASGEPQQCDTREAKEAGVCGFLAKPFRLGDLTDSVREVLDGRPVGAAGSEQPEEQTLALVGGG
jgi:PAS domain S-box-containing protein